MSEIIRKGGAPVRVSTGCAFTEGPAADGDGNLFFSDSPNNRIMVLRPTGETEVWCSPSGRANGMNFDPDGHLVACCAQGEGGRREVIRFVDGPDTVEVLAAAYDGKPLNSPNDLCFDPDGRIYFTDPRYGDRSDCEQDRMAVYRIEVDGELTRVIDDVETPNGILMTPDGRRIYLVDNNPEDWGARTLLTYEQSGGAWSRSGVVHDFAPGRGGDGMVLDVDGNVYVTAGDGEGGGIYVFGPDGDHLDFIRTPETPTNCTFGGEDLTTLYVTAMTSVYAIACNRPGWLAYPKLTGSV